MRLLIASDLHGSPEAAAFLRRRCETPGVSSS